MKEALLVVSFGGPERSEDVLPFLRNVTRGRGVPEERLVEVAAHYAHFGGRSPLPEQVRELAAAIERELASNGEATRVYIGHRNWHPFLAETLRQMKADGVERALAFVTSAFSSYSGCRQYLEDIEKARAEVGEGAPEIAKLRAFFDHPLWIDAVTDRVRTTLQEVPEDRRADTLLLFTAHSIPMSMAGGCAYEPQLREAMRLVGEALSHSCVGPTPREALLAFQSRSGPPSVPWLVPDVRDAIREAAKRGIRDVIVSPIGFVSDHVEVLYDLDVEARAVANEVGVGFHRAATAGTHPAFVAMIRELVRERTSGAAKRSLGTLGIKPDVCLSDCCPRGGRPG